MLDLNDPLPYGATPIDDSSGLKLSWIRTREQLNIAEAENILKASSRYFSGRKFPTKWFYDGFLRKIHENMFKDVWGWAGVYYQGPLRNIGIPSVHIPIQVRELCNDVLFWLGDKTDLTFLEQSARIHFRLAQIHPFHNGNGRHARLCADLYLQSLLGQRSTWPERVLTVGSNLRKDYIQSLKNADLGDYSDLTRLILQYGGRNPSIAEVLSSSFLKQHFSTPKVFETVQNLIRFGCKIDELSHDGHHPLQLAVRKNLPEMISLLMKNGGNPHQKDKSGLTPLDCAAKMQNRELIEFFQRRH